jgi:hypothetical protein
VKAVIAGVSDRVVARQGRVVAILARDSAESPLGVPPERASARRQQHDLLDEQGALIDAFLERSSDPLAERLRRHA